ncbi:MAG: aldo/keto reductase [Candidatus Margulisiibacteriota bacterium]
MIIKHSKDNSFKLPAIGQGMGEYPWDDSQISVIRAGIDLGMNLIDTAEEYDRGRSEEIVGKAVKGIRDKAVLSTKFSPRHNSSDEVSKAAEGSLRRLGTDHIDLYQIHWPNPSIPLEETLAAMERLVKDGKVRFIGLGNSYLGEVKRAGQLLKNNRIASLQVEYNLFDRIIEKEILPYCEANDVFIIGYSPLDKGRIGDGPEQKKLVLDLAKKYGKTPAQIALRWLIAKKPVVVIPKAGSLKHLQENAAAADFDLDPKDQEVIGRVFLQPEKDVLPSRIKVTVQGEGNRKVYQTIEQARENRLGYVPGPAELAENLKAEKNVKPVRLVRTSGQYDYELVEGRIRYWAWVLAHGDRPIPSYIRQDWNSGGKASK